MTRKKNNQTPHLLDPTDDLTPTDSPDELADTRELRRVVGLNAAEDPGSARLAAAADELQNTGEFVALGGEPIGGAAPSEGRADGVAGLPAAPDDQVSFWLNHLASEIERLQAKWNQVDGELRLRESRIEELRRELAAKDVAVEELVRDLTAVGAAKSESEQVLASVESRLTALLSDQAQSEARLADNSRQLDVAKASDAQLQLQLAAAHSQIERLQEQSAQEKQATVEADARAHELAAGNSELRGTIEVLESYIDRRNESWSQLNAKLTEYQDSLVIAERAAKDRDRKSAEQEQAKEQLFQQVLELERRCAELTGSLKERETANADLQTQLAQQIDAASQLRSELEIRGKAMAETAAQLDRQTQTRAARERDIVQRDETIAALEKARDEQSRLVAETAAVSEQRATRVAELEGALREREQLISQLEAKLLAKQKALDLLDRNVQLINDLGQSVHDFDRAFPAEAPGALHADRSVAVERDRAPLNTNRVAHFSRFDRKLLVALGEDEGQTYSLDKDDTTIGRSAHADIVVRNPFISRVHARILRQDADTVIEDPGSRNGISVNSRPVEHRATLHDGDTIRLGGTLEFRFVDSHERLSRRTPH